MDTSATPLAVWILGFLLILASLGVLLARKPVHACLSFLLSLLCLAGLYLQLSAQFISVMQILVYAGAILVIFMFVIILFQDAHDQIEHLKSTASRSYLFLSALAFLMTYTLLGMHFINFSGGEKNKVLPAGYGTVESLGKELYLNFFFPFEAVVLLFLIAIVGSLYTGKKATFIISSQDSDERDKSESKRRGLNEEDMAKAISNKEARSREVAAGQIPDEIMKAALKKEK